MGPQMFLQSSKRNPRKMQRKSERGYILLTLIFTFAVIAIVATMMAPSFVFEMRREREEEMIHRGVQYSRAIRAFVKKNGRYPMQLTDLDNTNQIRYLRRHYKDPITGKDFKILHQADVPLFSSGAGIAGAVAPGGLNGAAGIQAQIAQGLGAAQGQAGGQGSQLFGNPGVNNGTNNTDNGSDDQPFGQQGSQSGLQAAGGSGAGSPSPGGTGAANGQTGQATQNGPGTSSLFGNSNGNQPFGSGGPIIGVASISKEKSIRVFNKKDHYKDWYFVYDPTTDRGTVLINGPYQPPLQVSNGNLNGQQPNGQNGGVQNNSGTGFGGSGTNSPGGFQPPAPGQLPEQ